MSPFNIQQQDQFDLSHGFLPSTDPIQQLPAACAAWENAALHLPKLLMTRHFKKMLSTLPDFALDQLSLATDDERAMLILSYLGHAYVWGDRAPADRLPEFLAKPWASVAEKIGRPPVLSYASYALYNWRRLDIQKPIALDNIVLLQNFLGGEDEEWFILIHVDIEAKAIPGLQAMLPAMIVASQHDLIQLTIQLSIIADALTMMCKTLDRMPERCDPYIYFNRVRPYIHGWKNNPALPNGLIYEGVHEKPFFLKGETGAQSSIIPCLDALLGVVHADNPLKQHLEEMNQYMPPSHRALIDYITANTTVRHCVQKNKKHTSLRENYNACIELMTRFRKTHLGYAASYIQKQSQQSQSNPNAIGTGGTPFMQYLQDHLEETSSHCLT